MQRRTTAGCRFMDPSKISESRGYCRRFPPGWPSDIQQGRGVSALAVMRRE